MMLHGIQRVEQVHQALDGVGDAALGEWTEQHGAIHVRRRLSLREQIEFGLTLVDVRGTDDGVQRVRKMIQVVPRVRRIAMSELEA